jgi:hypothetical protein
MDKERFAQWLIPFLYGLGIGFGIAWLVPKQLLLLVAPIILLIMIALKYLLKYAWPWEASRPVDRP